MPGAEAPADALRIDASRAVVIPGLVNSHNARSLEHGEAAVEALQHAGIRAVHAVGAGFGQPGDHVHETLLRLRDRFETDPASPCASWR